ncbi:MAG: T9SS type A sorting domain-containing protein [Bacteroidales bacterium]
MKRTILIILFSMTGLVPSFAQQNAWVDISGNLPDFPYDTSIINGGADTIIANITDISFISDNEGWITTYHPFNDSAAILHTTDGGFTWEVQTVMRPCQVIHMVSNTLGYAASGGGKVFKTTNGGSNWLIHAITGTTISAMSFPPDSDTGYICSNSVSKMHQITPQGVNVINFNNAPWWWQSISAPSHELIWLSIGTAVYTFDSNGLTDQPTTSDDYNSICFFQNDLGWGCGLHGASSGAPGTIMGCLGKDIPWVVLSYTNGPLYDIFALDEDHLWATGMDGQIYYSDNASDFGFDTLTSTGWTNVNFDQQAAELTNEDLRVIFFTSPTNGFIGGANKTLLKYTQISSLGDDPQQNTFTLFPNPTSGKIRFNKSLTGYDDRWALYDIYGRAHPKAMVSTDNELDISALPPSVYILQLNSGKQIYRQKIIKQ